MGKAMTEEKQKTKQAEWEYLWKKQHAQAFKVAASTIGAQQATIAQGIYCFVSEAYPDAHPADLSHAMWLAMQMAVGPMRAADAVRQASVFPGK